LASDSTLGPQINRLYPDLRRNFAAFLTDYIFFAVAMAFVGVSTVLPAFVQQLTDSPLFVGLNGTIQTAGWLFPQLVAANYLGSKAQKKRYILLPSAVGRPIFLLLALVLIFGVAQHPALMLTIFFVGVALFWMCDALASVPWFDVLGKAIPARQRGRLFALAQVVSGLLAVGAGWLISYILGDVGPPFPQNYALLFLIAGILFGISWLAIATLKEPVERSEAEGVPSEDPFLPKLARIWKQDRRFRRYTVVRLLAGLSGLASSFYVIFATDQLGLGQGVVGSFTSAQVLGSMAGGALLGLLYEKWGGRRTIQAGLSAGLFAPLWALVLPALIPAGHAQLASGYSLVFVALGLLQSNFMQGFFNYLLDLSPASERATYIALSNTVNGVVLWPTALIGGAILKATDNSYLVLFAITAAGVGLGLLCTTRLAKVRS
jgi:MFS family permease